MALARTNLYGAEISTFHGGTSGAPVTGSFTPPANSLLVVTICGNADDDISGGVTPSGGSLTYTQRESTLNPDNNTHPFGSFNVHQMWTAPVGASPSSMTIQFTPANSFNTWRIWEIHIVAYTGYDTSSPIGAIGHFQATSFNVSQDAAPTLTLSAPPASSSMVFASMVAGAVDTTGPVTPGAGWTEIYDDVGLDLGFQSQERTGSTSTTVGWADVDTNNTTTGLWGNSGIAIEIKAAPATLITGWQNEAADVYQSKPQRLSAAPAFVSPFRTAGIAGVAWQGPREHVKLPPSVVFSAPPAIGRVPSAPSTIAGMAWFEPWDQAKAKQVNLETLPAFVSTFRTAGIAGMAFHEPPPDVVWQAKKVTVESLSAYDPWPPQVPISGMAFHAPMPDIVWSSKKATIESLIAYDPRPPQVPISGMAWFTQTEPLPPRHLGISDAPPGIPAPVVTVTWSFSSVDSLRLRPAPTDTPPAFVSTFRTAGISGMAWFEPADRDRPAVKVIFETPPAAFGRSVPPAASISGMAWYEPPDRDRPAAKINIEAPPAIALTPATLPVPIRGIAWFEPWTEKAPVRFIYETRPSYAPYVVAAPTVAWLTPQEFFYRPARRFDDAPPALGRLVGRISIPWFDVPDQPRPPRTVVTFDAPPAFGRNVAPPVGVAGIAWFMQEDFIRAKPRWNLDAPPAFGQVITQSFTVSGTPPERIIKFGPEVRTITFDAEIRTIRFGAESRDIEF